MHRKVAAALVVALALGVASCGGSETTTLGRAALARRIELACREGQRAGQREVDRRARGLNVKPILVMHQHILDAVDDLDSTGSAKTNLEAFKQAIRERLEIIERIADADGAEQQRLMRSAERDAARAGRQLVRALHGLGLESC